MNAPQIQSQQLLTQPNFLQQLMFVSSPPLQNTQTPNRGLQTDNASQVDDLMITQSPLSQRWFSEETLSILEIKEELIGVNDTSNLRMRSESESNLDDWEKMDVQEIDGKPPVKASKGKNKKIKLSKIKEVSPNKDLPIKRTPRAAAVRARAKCKGELTSDLNEDY